RVIARMYFGERYRFADVARVLGTDHQALLRRIDTLRPLLRRNLEGEGLPPELVSRLLERTEPVGADGFVLAKGLTSGETILYRVQEAPDKVYSLSPREFEELVAELLHRQGFQVTLTPPSRDGGFDMYAVRKDSLVETLYLVECKRYARTNRVGVEIVRALMGVVDTERANAGIIVTTSTFTQGAREFQRRLQNVLSLRDNRYLYDWLMLSRVPLSEAAG
ncbi:restriction endonuclease, partial [Longimicrobium sp.]|uniref:restriction endonuclease n=1 Tax=Longimicrobium sp. TaxID=2029185 RepID=UPI002E3507FA